ncbi:MAG: hypothetical protein O2865_06010 [Planctomycetota bacterium]|nr:hypothetical protein [Planctomycetota bacterium]MDA0933066.1 hypothetical protein [Planctomycetota bacterium]
MSDPPHDGALDRIYDYVHAHPAITTAAFVASTVMFVGGLLLVPWLIVRMPSDFFLRHDRPKPYRHPVVHALAVAARNLIGWPLLALGIAMLVLPGQGLLTILVAVALVDFPGKRRVELALVRQKHLHRGIDWLRHRAGVPPLVIPERGALSRDG